MLKAIIVDDEAPARSELRYMLNEQGQVETVTEAASVREAIDKLHDYPCDVVFLDISMPEATGLQFAEALQSLKLPPAVVFVTAYSEYALDAFSVDAVDYLLKPVDADRLDAAVKRANRSVVLNAHEQKSERIPAEKNGKKVLVEIGQIRFVTARDDYAFLHTEEGKFLTTANLAQLERRLTSYGFLRVHRGYVVNLSFIEEVETVSGGALLLSLKGVEEKIPVSRRKAVGLKRALGF